MNLRSSPRRNYFNLEHGITVEEDNTNNKGKQEINQENISPRKSYRKRAASFAYDFRNDITEPLPRRKASALASISAPLRGILKPSRFDDGNTVIGVMDVALKEEKEEESKPVIDRRKSLGRRVSFAPKASLREITLPEGSIESPMEEKRLKRKMQEIKNRRKSEATVLFASSSSASILDSNDDLNPKKKRRKSTQGLTRSTKSSKPKSSKSDKNENNDKNKNIDTNQITNQIKNISNDINKLQIGSFDKKSSQPDMEDITDVLIEIANAPLGVFSNSPHNYSFNTNTIESFEYKLPKQFSQTESTKEDDSFIQNDHHEVSMDFTYPLATKSHNDNEIQKESEDDSDNEFSMELTNNSINSVVNTYENEENEMTMEITKPIGNIYSNNSAEVSMEMTVPLNSNTSKNYNGEDNSDDSFDNENNNATITMDMTLATGRLIEQETMNVIESEDLNNMTKKGINENDQETNDINDDNYEDNEASLEFTKPLSKIISLQQSNESPAEDTSMHYTKVVGVGIISHEIPQLTSNSNANADILVSNYNEKEKNDIENNVSTANKNENDINNSVANHVEKTPEKQNIGSRLKETIELIRSSPLLNRRRSSSYSPLRRSLVSPKSPSLSKNKTSLSSPLVAMAEEMNSNPNIEIQSKITNILPSTPIRSTNIHNEGFIREITSSAKLKSRIESLTPHKPDSLPHLELRKTPKKNSVVSSLNEFKNNNISPEVVEERLFSPKDVENTQVSGLESSSLNATRPINVSEFFKMTDIQFLGGLSTRRQSSVNRELQFLHATVTNNTSYSKSEELYLKPFNECQKDLLEWLQDGILDEEKKLKTLEESLYNCRLFQNFISGDASTQKNVERQCKAAKNYFRLKSKNIWYQLKTNEYVKLIETLEENLEASNKKQAELQLESSKICVENDELRDSISSLNSKINQLQEEYDNIMNEFPNLILTEDADLDLESESQLINESNEELLKIREDLKTDLKNIESNIFSIEKKIENSNQIINKYENLSSIKLERLKETYKSLMEKLSINITKVSKSGFDFTYANDLSVNFEIRNGIQKFEFSCDNQVDHPFYSIFLESCLYCQLEDMSLKNAIKCIKNNWDIIHTIEKDAEMLLRYNVFSIENNKDEIECKIRFFSKEFRAKLYLIFRLSKHAIFDGNLDSLKWKLCDIKVAYGEFILSEVYNLVESATNKFGLNGVNDILLEFSGNDCIINGV